jgi:hypothetical protein
MSKGLLTPKMNCELRGAVPPTLLGAALARNASLASSSVGSAMAAATCGIAMGAAGTDTAIETADIALMENDPSEVGEAVHLGRRTSQVIQCNIAFSIVVKLVFLVLAIFGYTSLWLAITADTGANGTHKDRQWTVRNVIERLAAIRREKIVMGTVEFEKVTTPEPEATSSASRISFWNTPRLSTATEEQFLGALTIVTRGRVFRLCVTLR